MSIAQDQSFEGLATSPDNTARLERLLTGGATALTAPFATSSMGWDRACPDAEAVLVVTELLAALLDGRGSIVRVRAEAVKGAIEWLSAASADEHAERVQFLREMLMEAVRASRT